jgi:integrase
LAKKLTPRSHQNAQHVARKRGVYYFRRKLPEPLSGEIAVSLSTRAYREAEYLAEALTELFNHSIHTVSSPAELRTILRAYVDEQLAEDAEARLTAPPGRPLYTDSSRVDPHRTAQDADREVIGLVLSDATEALARRDFKSVAGIVDSLMQGHGIPEGQRTALAHGILEANVRALEEILRRVKGEAAVVFPDQPAPSGIPATTEATPIKPIGPLFSVELPKYVDHSVRNKEWRGQTKAQNEATFAMFVEVCGDLPVEAYTRRHLSDFYTVILGLPALYSKDKRWRGRPLREVVAEVIDDASIKRLTMKTAARHFSALGGFFTYAKRHGLIDGENPAHGFEFPKAGRKNGGRRMWEGEKLRKLFQSPVWTGSHPTFRSKPGKAIIKDDKYWLPLLGLYHGNRLEEFAQLRREDVKCAEGVWYLAIHGNDGRQIKNPQSARRVPLHPELERLGFLDYVRATAPPSGDMVFPLLKPGGPDKKVGYYFTKWWTNYRKTIGLYEPGLDYHSFRHGVTTKLFAAGVARDVVDELTGHEGEGTSQRVYKHDTPIPALREAIVKISWDELAGRYG